MNDLRYEFEFAIELCEGVGRSLSLSTHLYCLTLIQIIIHAPPYLLVLSLTVLLLLVILFSCRWVCWSAKDYVVIHGYTTAHTQFLNRCWSRALTCDDYNFHFISCISLLGPRWNRWSEDWLGFLLQMILWLRSTAPSRRLLFTANFNIAEILTDSPTRENYRDALVSEGQLCGDCNFEVWHEYSVSKGEEHHLWLLELLLNPVC